MDATHTDHREPHQVLDPSCFEELIKETEAEKARLLKAKEALEPGDMLEYWAEFLEEHLDRQI